MTSTETFAADFKVVDSEKYRNRTSYGLERTWRHRDGTILQAVVQVDEQALHCLARIAVLSADLTWTRLASFDGMTVARWVPLPSTTGFEAEAVLAPVAGALLDRALAILGRVDVV